MYIYIYVHVYGLFTKQGAPIGAKDEYKLLRNSTALQEGLSSLGGVGLGAAFSGVIRRILEGAWAAVFA